MVKNRNLSGESQEMETGEIEREEPELGPELKLNNKSNSNDKELS